MTRLTAYQAVFAFPLKTVGSAIGALKLYRRTRGDLVDVCAAVAIAARITDQLLHLNSCHFLEEDKTPDWLNGPAVRRRAEVWRAQGMTMHANRISFNEALDVLRAHAHTHDRLLDDLAADIVTGRAQVSIL